MCDTSSGFQVKDIERSDTKGVNSSVFGHNESLDANWIEKNMFATCLKE